MAARMTACLNVSTPDPTLVPKELATCYNNVTILDAIRTYKFIEITSLAPIANARKKARIKPTMTIHSSSGEYGSMVVDELLFLLYC